MKISALFIKMRYAPIADFGASSPNRTINFCGKAYWETSREIRIASITPAQRSCSTTMPIVNASFDLIDWLNAARIGHWLLQWSPSIEKLRFKFVDTVCRIKEPFSSSDEVQCGKG